MGKKSADAYVYKSSFPPCRCTVSLHRVIDVAQCLYKEHRMSKYSYNHVLVPYATEIPPKTTKLTCKTCNLSTSHC